jgi:hypothetical protein
MSAELNQEQRREVQRQVARFLGRSEAFAQMAPDRRREILADTAKVVERLAAGPGATADPYAVDLAAPWAAADAKHSFIDTSGDTPGPGMQGNVGKLLRNKQLKIGQVVGAGVTQAARMVHEIKFPEFVASLIQGTFHAIVTSSIEQMTAYAEMVKSVSTTLNDFRDQNTTDNQARDLLVQRYPQHFQIAVVDNQPKIGLRDGAEDLPMPNFKRDLGLSVDIGSLDEDMIEEQLVPAARDDLARGRQQLLATIILMGINRIVVTDGKINARLRFQFQAKESQKMTAAAYDYVKTGNVYATEGTSDEGGERTGASHGSDGSTEGETENKYAKGTYKSSITPDVRVTSQVDMSSTGSIQASGQIMGEVSINFKSETFPLEKMVDTSQMMRLESAQQGGAGRGAPPPRAAGNAPTAGAPGGGAAGTPPGGTTGTTPQPTQPTQQPPAQRPA